MKIQLLILLLCAFSLTACLKKPEADFYQGAGNYRNPYVGGSVGDTIFLTNNSHYAKEYKWTISTGETFTTKDLAYVVPISTDANSHFTIQLEAFNGTHKKPGTVIRDVTLSHPYMRVVFWGKTGAKPYNHIIVDNRPDLTADLQYPSTSQPVLPERYSTSMDNYVIFSNYDIQTANMEYLSHHTYAAYYSSTDSITGSFDMNSLTTYVQLY